MTISHLGAFRRSVELTIVAFLIDFPTKSNAPRLKRLLGRLQTTWRAAG